jgi:hypothetical protein
MKLLLPLLMLSAIQAATLSIAQARSFVCKFEQDPVVSTKVFNSEIPLLFTHLLIKHTDGTPDHEKTDNYLSPTNVCGSPVNFAADCKATERIRQQRDGEEYELTVNCRGGLRATTYLNEYGTGEHRCYRNSASFDSLVLNECETVLHLANKNTVLGSDPKKPSNPFIKCVIEAGMGAVFGKERSIKSYVAAAGVDDDKAPQRVALKFITEDKTGKADILQAVLTSADTAKKWQIGQAGSEVFYFSTKISTAAELQKRDGTPLAKFDIAACK